MEHRFPAKDDTV